MGASNDKPQPQPQKQIDPMEIMLDMKMTSKRFERESAKAAKEEQQQISKARNALKKNNEEGAKMFLQNAAMKKQESISCLRMAHKLQAIQFSMKSNLNNQQMAQTLNRLTPYLQQHTTTLPIEQIYGEMQNFENAMDEITVQNKIINTAVNTNSDASHDIMVDQMFQQMKNEQMAEIDAEINISNNAQYQQLQNNQQQQQQNQFNNYNQQQQY